LILGVKKKSRLSPKKSERVGEKRLSQSGEKIGASGRREGHPEKDPAKKIMQKNVALKRAYAPSSKIGKSHERYRVKKRGERARTREGDRKIEGKCREKSDWFDRKKPLGPLFGSQEA